MRRPLAAAGFALHAVAHSLPGMRSADGAAAWAAGVAPLLAETARWMATLLWAGATAGLLGAAFTMAGCRGFRGGWRPWATAGAVASIPLLALNWGHWLAAPGLLVDLAILFITWPAQEPDSPVVVPAPARRLRFRDLLALGVVALACATVLARPWHMRWGSTEAELRAALPGDDGTVRPVYQIQHAVTIDAPAGEVWPWLAQLGRDRGGFYSYAWLENLFGLRIRNADRIHPEWQSIATGDSVFATFPGWLGIDRRLGWRIGQVEPGRALELETWGTFVLEPIDSCSTRLIVRTRGASDDRLVNLVLAPISVFAFEPAHFIMERRMLLTLKARAESGRHGAGA